MANVETVDSPAGLARLGAAWDDVVAESDAASLFVTREWLFPWWRHLGRGRRLSVRVVRRGGEVIAIAPWCSRGVALGAHPALPCVEPLGIGPAGSDYVDIVARRGAEQEAIEALADHLGTTAPVVSLRRLRTGSSLAQSLASELVRRRWTALARSDEAAPFIPRQGTFDDHLGRMSSKLRHNFRHKLRNLEKQHAVELFTVTRADELAAALRSMIALHEARWEARGRSEAFSSPALRAFHDEVSSRALARGWLRLQLLKVDGKPVAATYGFRHRDVFHYYQAGLDPAHAQQSVGFLALGLAIRSAFAEGVTEFDMLHGEQTYKRHWTRELRQLTRIELYPPGARGWLYRHATALELQARRVGRALLERATPVEPAQGAPPARAGNGAEKPAPVLGSDDTNEV
ncbi:MAG: GNAT family N-acetyltransferase [Myxococcales bacterium]|nr:GNAT family N-acetyltransferase [Myxococcales bacterium]